MLFLSVVFNFDRSIFVNSFTPINPKYRFPPSLEAYLHGEVATGYAIRGSAFFGFRIFHPLPFFVFGAENLAKCVYWVYSRVAFPLVNKAITSCRGINTLRTLLISGRSSRLCVFDSRHLCCRVSSLGSTLKCKIVGVLHLLCTHRLRLIVGVR